MSKIIKHRTFGRISIRKKNDGVYLVSARDLLHPEIVSFENALMSFARSLDNTISCRRSFVPLKGVLND